MRSLLACVASLLGLVGSLQAEDFHFDDLRRLLDEQRSGTAEQLIAALPDDLRRHYALVFSSRSLQEASFENPRALLFGSQATLIVSFNGDPAQRGFDAVETAEFDAATASFVFREISFVDGAAHISEANPARCAACHDAPARPIWDAPPLWPGVYGERYGVAPSAAETAGLRRFLARQPDHPRYRQLIGADDLLRRETYLARGTAAYNGVSAEPPNARLSKLLTALNVRSIVARLASRPEFGAHLSVLLAAAGSRCGSLEQFYPSGMRATVRNELEAFTSALREADRRQAAAKRDRQAGSSGGPRRLAGPSDLPGLRYVAERGLRVRTSNWSLALERNSYDLSAPSGSVSLEQALYAFLVRTDPGLRKADALGEFAAGDAYCEHLRRNSVASLESWYALHPLPPALADPPVSVVSLEVCARCHEGGVAPSLPFSDPAALSATLNHDGYPHGRLLDEILFRLTPQAAAGRMPRGLNLDPEQQSAYERYFLALARTGN